MTPLSGLRIETYINIVNSLQGWSYRIEGGHQAPQVTVFDGVHHYSAIARKDQTVADTFSEVLGIAVKKSLDRISQG